MNQGALAMWIIFAIADNGRLSEIYLDIWQSVFERKSSEILG